MAKNKTKFACQECGYESPQMDGTMSWLWQMEHDGGRTNVSKEGVLSEEPTRSRRPALPITEVSGEKHPRSDTGIRELNRVLGGGLVPGSMILVGAIRASENRRCFCKLPIDWRAGDADPLCIRGGIGRTDPVAGGSFGSAFILELFVAAETDLDSRRRLGGRGLPPSAGGGFDPDGLLSDVTSAPGSVAQVRECTGRLMRLAKGQGIAVIIVGHVTKEGAIAGPRMLEHMVDCVLYFEGERHHTYRVLRAVKNRFGSTNEIGLFEMRTRVSPKWKILRRCSCPNVPPGSPDRR